MLSSLETRSLTDKRYSKNIIRSLACHSHYEWQQFDDLFLDYWQSIVEESDNPGINNWRRRPRNKITGIGGSTLDNPDDMIDLTKLSGSGAGRQRTISKADFRFLNDHKATREIERLAEQLAMQLNKRIRRRHVIQSNGIKLDIRQTIRRNLSHGGLPVRAFYQNHCREPLHIVIMHDVSHSMAWNNPLLFRFARGIVRAFKTSEAFAFHTELFKVTEFYREQSLQRMKQRLEARNHLWMGGTCIAESIDKFNRHHAAKTLTSKTIFIIISDGFDTNEPDYLAHELMIIKKSTKKTIWLNPMLGRVEYDTYEESMQAAMPYIDRLAPAHSLESLKNTISYIAQECR